jgi:hypothetical protein
LARWSRALAFFVPRLSSDAADVITFADRGGHAQLPIQQQ